MKRSNLVLFLLALGLSGSVTSEVLPVEPTSRSLIGARPTMTFLTEATNAEVTLVVVMGYPGHFGLKTGDSEVRNQTARMLLAIPYRQRVKANVVILDSPSPLQGIPARSSADHLERIHSVVNFYSNKLNKPVWIFGHSDGSISVSEYLNRSIESRNSVAGIILSAGRSETRITDDWALPALVLHHDRDGCEVTPYEGAQRYYLTIKARNSSLTELATVQGGVSSGSPCSTGFHMYERANGEALTHVENFLYRNIKH
jgi:hypothetical protein